MTPSLTEYVADQPLATAATDHGAKAALTQLAVLRVSGDDTRTFLHAQFTADLKRLDLLRGGLAAWCSPKGRVLFLMHVLNLGDAWLLLAPRCEIAALLKRLRMYVLRARVTVEDLSADWSVMGLLQPAGVAPGGIERDGDCLRLTVTPTLSYAFGPHPAVLGHWLASALPAVDEACWEGLEIDALLPRIVAPLGERFLPQALDLERLQGLHFDKGCYPGQEVIARLKYRGQVKAGLRRAVCAGALAPGDRLYRENASAAVGDVLRVATTGSICRALVVIDFDATDAPLLAREPGGPVLRCEP